LVVWADNDVFQSGLHASFKLNASGESVIFSTGASIYDQVNYGVQTTDVSYARCPDGGVTFAFVAPTHLASNNCFATVASASFDVKVFPNPFNDFITIQLDEQLTSFISITDVNGKTLFNEEVTKPEIQLSTSNWANGMYIMTIQNERGLKSLKLIK
jgi:hypothetical protein